MKFLAYDTSSETLSIAIFENDALVAEREFPLFTRHSADLTPSLEKVFKENKMRPEELEVIAVGLGPGSFTGLRVGITTAKVMAYALKKKIIGIPSIEAIARGVEDWDGPVAVVLDAKKGKIYSAVYQKRGIDWRLIQKPALDTLDSFRVRLPKKTRVVDDVSRGDPTGRPYAKASKIGEAAWARIQKKKFDDPWRLEPLYLHPRDCNVTPPPV